jgi:hypothetical protein
MTMPVHGTCTRTASSIHACTLQTCSIACIAPASQLLSSCICTPSKTCTPCARPERAVRRRRCACSPDCTPAGSGLRLRVHRQGVCPPVELNLYTGCHTVCGAEPCTPGKSSPSCTPVRGGLSHATAELEPVRLDVRRSEHVRQAKPEPVRRASNC